MRFRTTLILFALTAALVVFIKFYETKRPNTEEANRRAQNVINFERDKIDGVVIQNGEERIELKRADKKWRLESPVKDLADGSTVDSLLFDLEDWKKTQLSAEKKSRPTRAGWRNTVWPKRSFGSSSKARTHRRRFYSVTTPLWKARPMCGWRIRRMSFSPRSRSRTRFQKSPRNFGTAN